MTGDVPNPQGPIGRSRHHGLLPRKKAHGCYLLRVAGELVYHPSVLLVPNTTSLVGAACADDVAFVQCNNETVTVRGSN